MFRLCSSPYVSWIPLNPSDMTDVNAKSYRSTPREPDKGIGRRVKPGKINLAAIVKGGAMRSRFGSRLL